MIPHFSGAFGLSRVFGLSRAFELFPAFRVFPAFGPSRIWPLVAALALGLNVSQAVAQESPVVSIKEFMFVPMSTTIKAGSTVTWKNLDDEAHSIIAEGGLFRSDALDQNGTFSFRFDKPGVYKVVCGLHPYMKETITVE